MPRIATDVVLLPDTTMMARAIEINRRIVRECSAEIVLNEMDCLPHLSLAMGCIEERDIARIRSVLERLAAEVPVRRLTALRIQVVGNSRGEDISLLEIERTGELQRLHERVMQETEPFFGHDGEHAVFYDDGVARSARDWVSQYPQKAAHEGFSPHVTLGYGHAEAEWPFPTPFTASRLALCHLGNHCTCRAVLAEVRME